MYAKIIEENVISYPYTIQQLKSDFPHVSFASNLEVDYETLAFYNVHRIYEGAHPVFNQKTHKLEEGQPVFNGTRWEQSWNVVARTQEEMLADAEKIKQDIVNAVQMRLDSFAQTRNYDNILSACTYAGSAIEKFAVEGQYAVVVRDATWQALYQILADVVSEVRPAPESFADIEAELPSLQWPN